MSYRERGRKRRPFPPSTPLEITERQGKDRYEIIGMKLTEKFNTIYTKVRMLHTQRKEDGDRTMGSKRQGRNNRKLEAEIQEE